MFFLWWSWYSIACRGEPLINSLVKEKWPAYWALLPIGVWQVGWFEWRKIDCIRELDSTKKKRIARFYDSRVKYKSFKVGDLVWNVILPMDWSCREFGKWSHKWEGLFKITKLFSGNAYALVEINSGYEINSINGKYLKLYRPTIYEVNIYKIWVNKIFLYSLVEVQTTWSITESTKITRIWQLNSTS